MKCEKFTDNGRQVMAIVPMDKGPCELKSYIDNVLVTDENEIYRNTIGNQFILLLYVGENFSHVFLLKNM